MNEATLQLKNPDALDELKQSLKLRGCRRCQLVLISNPAGNQPEDFIRIAEYIRQYDPKITVTVVTNRLRGLAYMAARLALPTLVISLVPLARYRPLRGRFLHGQALSKSQEYELLEAAGFSVPRWQIIREDQTPDLSDYGPYVVTKPNRGKRGALVKIKKSYKVGVASQSKKANEHQGRHAEEVDANSEMLAQKFIYTGKWPVCYRVTTLFGNVLSSLKIEADHERMPLHSPDNFAGVGNVVATGRGCVQSFSSDEEIIRYAEAAHSAFPDIPLLGFDIVREVSTGKLYILEANAVGYVWHFSSPIGLNIQSDNNLHFESQYDGIRKAALILAEKTQALAR